MKRFIFAALAVLISVVPVSGQQMQPPVLETVVQYNPVNSRVFASGSNVATVTISGVTGQRVRISVPERCCSIRQA